MIQSLYYTKDGPIRANLNLDEINAVLQEGRGTLWVDLTDEPVDSSMHILRDVFGFHPLAVDDALEESHVPKVDDWGSYLYLVLHAVIFNEKADERIDTLELDLFLGQNYLVTYHITPLATVDRVWSSCQKDVRHMERGADYLLYKVADELASDYMPVVEKIDDLIDEIEDQIFVDSETSLPERIFTLKRALLLMRRILAPQREVLNKLARGDFPMIDSPDRVFFRDVYDHLVRLYDITDSMRDLVGSVLDMHLSVVNNRMNGVMKTLTVITTLFMPISFLASFFGMNFFQPAIPLPAWTGGAAFGLTLVGMLLIPVGMFLWMRKRAWM